MGPIGTYSSSSAHASSPAPILRYVSRKAGSNTGPSMILSRQELQTTARTAPARWRHRKRSLDKQANFGGAEAAGPRRTDPGFAEWVVPVTQSPISPGLCRVAIPKPRNVNVSVLIPRDTQLLIAHTKVVDSSGHSHSRPNSHMQVFSFEYGSISPHQRQVQGEASQSAEGNHQVHGARRHDQSCWRYVNWTKIS